MKNPRHRLALLLLLVVLVAVGLRTLWLPSTGDWDPKKKADPGGRSTSRIQSAVGKQPGKVHPSREPKAIPHLSALGKLTEKECEDRIGKILADTDESRSLRALQLLQIARADTIPMELRNESFAHALNLLEEEDIMYLLPMASSQDTPPEMLEGVMGAARNHPIHKDAMELALAVLKNPANPEPDNAREFIAFLLDVDAETPVAGLIHEAERVLGVWPEGIDDVSEVLERFPPESKGGQPQPPKVN